MSITDLVTDVSHTPAECYVYRKRDIQILALQRSAMCGKTTYRSSGAEAPSRFDAIDILLLWSKGMPFEYGVGFIYAQSGVPIAIRVSGLHLLLFLVPSPCCIHPYCPKTLATATKSKTLTTPSPFTSGAFSPNPLATATRSRMFTIPSSLTSCLSVVLFR